LLTGQRPFAGETFSPPNLPSYLWNGYNQVGKPQPGGDGLWQPETLVLLQTLLRASVRAARVAASEPRRQGKTPRGC
jgi:hypothetical protein